MADESVAVWYMRYGVPCYSLEDDEEEAASLAASIEDQGDGSVLGVQFADGRTLSVKQWDAYHAECQRRHEDEERRVAERRSQPPRPRREIRDPFEGRPATVDTDAPGWLGKPLR